MHQVAEAGEDFVGVMVGIGERFGRTEVAGPVADVGGGGEAVVLPPRGAAAAVAGGGGAEGVLFHSQSRGAFGAAAEDGDVADEGGEVLESGEGGVVGIAVPMGEGVGDADGEETGGVIGHEGGGFFEVGGGVGFFLDVFKKLAPGLPLGIAAVAPFGEVLFADGFAVEAVLEDALDFGEFVEPNDDFAAGGVGFEAGVEFLADVAGETGDFAGSVHLKVRGKILEVRCGRRSGRKAENDPTNSGAGIKGGGCQMVLGWKTWAFVSGRNEQEGAEGAESGRVPRALRTAVHPMVSIPSVASPWCSEIEPRMVRIEQTLRSGLFRRVFRVIRGFCCLFLVTKDGV